MGPLVWFQLPLIPRYLLTAILNAPHCANMGTLDTIRVFIWDFGLVILNLVTYPFRHKVGAVIPKGLPGHDGIWPEFVPPRGGDSRCSCPALNAMANHGTFKSSKHPSNYLTVVFRGFRHSPAQWQEYTAPRTR